MPQTQPQCTRNVTTGNGGAHGGDHHDAHPPYVIGGVRGGGAPQNPEATSAQEVCAVLTARQLPLPFTQQKETRQQRCQRLLSGDLGRVVRTASTLLFNYDQATEATTTGRPRP